MWYICSEESDTMTMKAFLEGKKETRSENGIYYFILKNFEHVKVVSNIFNSRKEQTFIVKHIKISIKGSYYIENYELWNFVNHQ